MASTARSEADCKEFFDDEKTLKLKIKRLAKLIRNSKHFCAFTGAGISTAAGIADFRSGINTVLDTGTGKWAAQSAKAQGKSKQIKKNKRAKSSIKAIPTASHMALVSLMTTGPKYLKCMISQNTDGLHRRSGMPVDQLCELHGNTTLEVCDKCGRGYMRDYRCRNSLRKQKVHDHKTGRLCSIPKCRGKLHDTIINFGEDLNQDILDKAQENTDQCDVMLALGSSLTVTPAADLPEEVGDRWVEQKEKGQKPTNHLVIVNLQKTPLDDVCSLRIFAKIDDVMVPLMKELGLEIPEWKLQRFMKVTVQPLGNKPDLKKLVISAVDVDGINATVFQEVKLSHNGNSIEKIQRKKSEKDKEREEREARDARRALRDAQRAKLRMALKAKKMEQKKREQASNGNANPMDVNGINATVQDVKAKHSGKSSAKQIGSSKKPQESGEEFPFQIQSKMLESINNDDEQKENENASNPSHGLVANLSSRLLRRLNVSNSSNPSNGLVAELTFFGNYSEPQLLIPLQPFLDNATSSTNENGDDETLEFMCRLVMDIGTKQWQIFPLSKENAMIQEATKEMDLLAINQMD